MTDHSNDPDVQKVSSTLITIVSGLLEGKGLVVPFTEIPGMISAGKRMSTKEGAGKEVFHKLLGVILTEHPEVIDLAFAGLSEVTKNKIRAMINTPEIKNAERA